MLTLLRHLNSYKKLQIHLSGTLEAECMFFIAKIKEAFLHIKALLADCKFFNIHRLLGLAKWLPQNRSTYNKCSSAEKSQTCSFIAKTSGLYIHRKLISQYAFGGA